MHRRRLAYIGIAVALLVAGRFLSTPKAIAPTPPSAPVASRAPEEPSAAPLKHPPSSVSELGVVSLRPESELRELADRDRVASLVQPAHCGNADACDAVRAALRDERSTHLEVVGAADWVLDRAGIDAGMSDKGAHVFVVHVATATGARQIALRASFAAAAAVAAKIDGRVHDPVLARVESARDFSFHAVTEPLGAPVFRRDRIELLYEPKQAGSVRLLTAGLSRWGAPDVEAASVPVADKDRAGAIVLETAESIANGQRPRAPVASVHPEAGDPNDFMARVTVPAR